MRKAVLGLVAAAGLATGCASTAGEPWRSVRLGMPDEQGINLGGKVCEVSRGEGNTIVHRYLDGGTISYARDDQGEWRVIAWQRP